MIAEAIATTRVKKTPAKVSAHLLSSQNTLIGRVGQVFDTGEDVVQLVGLPMRIYCFRDPEHIRHIYTTEPTATSKLPGLLPRIAWIMRNGSFIHPGGEEWRRRRQATKPFFARRPSLDLAATVPAIIESHLVRWDVFADTGRPIDIERELGALTVAMVLKALFSADIGDEAASLYADTARTLQGFMRALPPWVPTPESAPFRRAALRVRGYLHGLATERANHPTQHEDILSGLLAAHRADASAPWPIDDVVDEMLSIYFGAAIVRIPLVWMFYLLSKHPSVARSLRRETLEQTGTRLPEPADLPAMDLGRRVFLETTRLYPPVWGYPRYAKSPVSFDGYELPARSLLLPLGYFAHRHPRYWKNPEGFDPDRFAPDQEAHRPPFAHYPFGGGPRACLGRNIAPVMCRLVLAAISKRFELHYAPRTPGEPMPQFGFELAPRNSLWMTVHRAS